MAKKPLISVTALADRPQHPPEFPATTLQFANLLPRQREMPPAVPKECNWRASSSAVKADQLYRIVDARRPVRFATSPISSLPMPSVKGLIPTLASIGRRQEAGNVEKRP